MNPANFHKIRFTVTATNLNLADTAEQTLYTFATGVPRVFVPKLLTLKRAKGTPYTLGAIQKRVSQHDLPLTKSFNSGYDATDRLLLFYLKGDDDTPHRERLIFRAPAMELLGNRTVSTVVSQDETKMVAFPLIDGSTWKPNDFTSFVMASNVALSSGTGSLTGELWWEAFPV